MRDIIIGAIRFSLVSWIICGVIYPLAATVIAQVVFPFSANGSLLKRSDGVIIGSRLIGQNWTDPRYFHGRPSATAGPAPNDPEESIAAPYNASQSAGSNLGPTSEDLFHRLTTDRAALEATQPQLVGMKLPADMLTTSASGLDPDISIANAKLQARRVATARGLAETRVLSLIEPHVIARDLGVFGEPRMNVLELNLALDRLSR
jgi:potassium-transporting ATPase KdpC subunit